MELRNTPLLDGPAAILPRVALAAWSGIVLSAIVAAPLAAGTGRAEGWFLYQAMDLFCHQEPGRSWRLEGYPLAVCARCAGVYAGLLLAALSGPRLPPKAVGAALALVGGSWAAEFAGLASLSNGIRSLTGLVLGGSIGAVLAMRPRRGAAAAR